VRLKHWLDGKRKGIADLHRRAQVSQRANENYLDALSAVDDSTPLSTIFDGVSRPVIHHGRRSRAFRIGDPRDIALLKAVCRGEFAMTGFRNRADPELSERAASSRCRVTRSGARNASPVSSGASWSTSANRFALCRSCDKPRRRVTFGKTGAQ
jgi:hypothetical protein